MRKKSFLKKQALKDAEEIIVADDLNKADIQGSIKNKHLFAKGGKLIHILTFWGRLIQLFPLKRVKIEIL